MTKTSEKQRVIIVRHGAVEPKWKGICYGCMDVPLCTSWMTESQTLVSNLAMLRPDLILHSGLTRTRWLAERVEQQLLADGLPAVQCLSDARLRERDFGAWEGLSWDDAFASDPEHFHDLIMKPETYRPPGGETTRQMQLRMIQWFEQLPLHRIIVAISHSGPAASLAGGLLGLPADQWTQWMLSYGDTVVIESTGAERRIVAVRRGLD
jgi:broad specificity phosphatase PhoE